MLQCTQLLTYLQHLVRGGLNARWHVGGAKGRLLHIAKVVLWVLVQNHLPNWDEREVLVGPHLHRGEEGGGYGREELCNYLVDTLIY